MAQPLGGPVRRRRGPRWPVVIFVSLLVVPMIELAAIIAVGQVIGGWPTLFLLVVESLLGAVIVRREGGRAWAALRTALQTGRMPSRELADGALVLVGGTLLLTPGFVTDAVGFFFVLPVTRPITRRWLEAAVRRRMLGGPGGPAGTAFGGSWPPGQGGPWSSSGGTSTQGGSRSAGRSDPDDPDIIEGEVL